MNAPSPWTVTHVDLTAPLPVLQGPQAHFVVFWAHSVPLGHFVAHPEHLPMPVPQLRALATETVATAVRHYLVPPIRESPPQWDTPADPGDGLNPRSVLKRLEDRLALSAAPAAGCAPVSVVVCTRDRPRPLRRCLDALLNLDPLPHEIIVVDNAPRTDATRDLVEGTPGVRYVREPRPGLDVARNTGVRHSSGAIVAFTDDDVTVHPDWVRRLRRGFRTPEVMAVTGLVLPAKLQTEAERHFELHWGFNRGYRPRIFDAHFFAAQRDYGVPVWEIGAGANMAFRRDAFRHVGLFDERLDVGAAGCSGDTELWYRLLAEGYTCRYEPAAVTFHTHRATPDDLRDQIFHYMRGHAVALLVQYEKYGYWGELRRLVRTLPVHYARLLLRRVRPGPAPQARLLWTQVRGCLSGVAYYLKNRNVPHWAPAPDEPFADAERPSSEVGTKRTEHEVDIAPHERSAFKE